MDPNEAHKNLRQAARRVMSRPQPNEPDDITEMGEAAIALDDWLSRGGFLPDAWKPREVHIARHAGPGITTEPPDPHADTFTLHINLGNDAMQTNEDIARALRKVAKQLESGATFNAINDDNGNVIGDFEVNRENLDHDDDHDDGIESKLYSGADEPNDSE